MRDACEKKMSKCAGCDDPKCSVKMIGGGDATSTYWDEVVCVGRCPEMCGGIPNLGDCAQGCAFECSAGRHSDDGSFGAGAVDCAAIETPFECDRGRRPPVPFFRLV